MESVNVYKRELKRILNEFNIKYNIIKPLKNPRGKNYFYVYFRKVSMTDLIRLDESKQVTPITFFRKPYGSAFSCRVEFTEDLSRRLIPNGKSDSIPQ